MRVRIIPPISSISSKNQMADYSATRSPKTTPPLCQNCKEANANEFEMLLEGEVSKIISELKEK